MDRTETRLFEHKGERYYTTTCFCASVTERPSQCRPTDPYTCLGALWMERGLYVRKPGYANWTEHIPLKGMG